jgi:VCBS repeat-containing protein
VSDVSDGDFTINAVNEPPVAVDDEYTTDEDTILIVLADGTPPGILDNDYDDEDDLTVSKVEEEAGNVGQEITLDSGALLTVYSDGGFKYDPNGQFDHLASLGQATDSFTYRANDRALDSIGEATVTIYIGGVNDSPVAVDDTATTNEDTAVNIAVLANDYDPDRTPLTVDTYTQPDHGMVTLNDNGSFDYTPDPDFNGTDAFTYTIKDDHGVTDTATVTITVNSVNDAPDAVDDAAATDEDTPVDIPVLANDTDADGDTLTVGAVTTPEHGSAEIVANQVRYTPAANYNGPDSLAYTISDGNGGTDTATVTVTVTAVNDAPVANAGPDQTKEQTRAAGTPVTLDGSSSSDVDGDTLTYTWKEGNTVLAGPTRQKTAEVVLQLGKHTIQLIVADG